MQIVAPASSKLSVRRSGRVSPMARVELQWRGRRLVSCSEPGRAGMVSHVDVPKSPRVSTLACTPSQARLNQGLSGHRSSKSRPGIPDARGRPSCQSRMKADLARSPIPRRWGGSRQSTLGLVAHGDRRGCLSADRCRSTDRYFDFVPWSPTGLGSNATKSRRVMVVETITTFGPSLRASRHEHDQIPRHLQEIPRWPTP